MTYYEIWQLEKYGNILPGSGEEETENGSEEEESYLSMLGRILGRDLEAEDRNSD